jgi:AcrR family transcriptional regulator
MSDRLNTRERILEVSLRLFNERGYAATSLAEIAKGAGLAKGNLTYHFPTKYDLVLEFASRAREERRENVSKPRPGALADEYVALLSGMEQARKFRFLMRDHAQFRKSSRARPPDPEAMAEIETLLDLLRRMQKEGMLRRLGADLPALARSVWMVSRFWVDHLDQDEGRKEVTWADLERGIRHHLAVLQPCLTASARREFEAALARLAVEQVMRIDERMERP